MPFKSDAQRKLCYVLKGKGQAGSWDCDEWSEATGKKKLPEHVEDQTEKKALGLTNKLKGGVGDNKNPADFDRAELNSGIKEEKEHTNDTDIATEIAVDHLSEDPKYYSNEEKQSAEIWQSGKGRAALVLTALLGGGFSWLKHSLKQVKKPPVTEVSDAPLVISEMPIAEKAAFFSKLAAARPGLWANIRAKRKRGETAAKPGDEDYPDSKNWAKVTAISEKKAQCWEGYERVPGTKPLTSGSCRPVGKKKKETEKQSGEAWQTAEGKNPEGGLNEKGRASLRAQGHDIKRPQPEGGPRKDSFCARMSGMKAKLTSKETANDPDSRINKALRKWKCGNDAFEQIAALAKLAVDQASDSYMKMKMEVQRQQIAKMKADAERVRIASGAPKPSGNGTYSYSGTVFPDRVENVQHSFTPPMPQNQGGFPQQPVQTPNMSGRAIAPPNSTSPTYNSPSNTFAPRMARPAPSPANRWKPIDISGDRRRKEVEMGWARGSMDQGGEHYAQNGPRSAELVKQYGPTGAPPKPTTPNPTAQVPNSRVPKAPSSTYATPRFSSTPPNWATQGWNPKL